MELTCKKSSRPGPIGRLARLALALVVLDLVWRPMTRSGPQDIVNPFLWIYAAIAILLLPYVANLGFGLRLGRGPQAAVILVGLILAMVSWFVYGVHIGVPTWWWMKGTMLYAYSHLGLSLALSAILGTRGNEMRAIPELMGLGVGDSEQECVGLICQIDRWEECLRSRRED